MEIVLGWNCGGVGTSFLSSALTAAGVQHTEHKAYQDTYDHSEAYHRVIPLCSREDFNQLFLKSGEQVHSELEKILRSCPNAAISFVINNCPSSVEDLKASIEERGGSVICTVPSRYKFNKMDQTGSIDTEDEELQYFIQQIKALNN
ncbi:hypothetical protein AB6D66_00670 [Vibrio pomeroyi]|uniref:Uncharacterized protein n=1 Tax=Vibrio pomeroyi TaxID=198832 RepID=A0ABV4MQY3_9VIBR|nr:hypothetical protein [Vibrio atlanticus]MCZ4311425.1 hypothetical protein [Vibrio atlanticus]